MYGGIDSGDNVLADMWWFDGTGWVKKCDPCTPGKRRSTRMVYYGAIQSLVLFGGNTAPGQSEASVLGDTWLFDSFGTWTNCQGCQPPNAPSARESHGMTWYQDSTPPNNKVVLFGGRGRAVDCPNDGICGDTWIFDGTQWALCAPPTGCNNPTPGRRSSPALAFQGGQNRVVLYGGSGPTPQEAPLFDTWFWDGTEWAPCDPQAVCSEANSPPRRSGHRMEFNVLDGRILLFGGFTVGGQTLSDTWFWNGSRWCGPTTVPACTQPASPSKRCCSGLAYYGDGIRKIVLFGGSDIPAPGLEVRLGDTWTWDATNHWTCLLQC